MSRRSFGHIRKLPSGRHQASYLGPKGFRVNAPYTFLTRGDASAWLSSQEVQLRNGDLNARHSVTSPENAIFEEYLERHIELQTNSDGALLRESTKSLYRRLLRVNLGHFWGRSMASITAAEVSEWWANSISAGKRTTSAKAYKLLSAAMRRALGERVVTTNPCMVKGAQSATTGKRVLVPTLEEVGLIAKNINERYSAMVILLAFGGFRFGEITELRRKDVGSTVIFSGGDERKPKTAYVFSVERAVTLLSRKGGTSKHHVDKPKSKAGIRKVVVSSAFNELILQVLSSIPDDPESLLFPAARGPQVHLRHDVFMNSWRPALKRAGIPSGKFSPHALRHFAGSQLHLSGANIPELKEWLGDSSTAAVMRYVHSTGRTSELSDSMGNRWQNVA